MSSNNSIDSFAKELLSRMCGPPDCKQNCNSKQNSGKEKNSQNSTKEKSNCILNLKPAQALVIIALLGGVLEVDSILVDRDQVVQILLEGSLKKPDNNENQELNSMLDYIGSQSFDDVVKALINRLS